MGKSDKSKFVPEPISIWIGSGDALKEYKVTPAPWGSLIRLRTILRETLNDVTGLWNAELVSAVQKPSEGNPDDAPANLKQLVANDQLWDILDKLLEKPKEIFELAIPGIDTEHFNPDNPNGITIPQVWATFEVVVEVNKIEVAKKLLGGLMTTTTA